MLLFHAVQIRADSPSLAEPYAGSNHGSATEEVVNTGAMEIADADGIVEDIEEGEAPGLCAVCCQLEPPGFDPDAAGTGDSDCQVRDYRSHNLSYLISLT